MSTQGEFRFGGWTLVRATGELHRAGARRRLQSQPLQVLEALLEEPGEMVTREQLIARLWPRGIVDFDTALNSTVRRLRTALDDHADEPKYIATIPKRGYRFVGTLDAPVVAEPAVVEHAPAAERADLKGRRRRRSWVVAAVAGVVALAAGLSVSAFRSSVAPSPAPASVGEGATSAAALVQQARFLLQRRAPGDVAKARERFERALQADPTHSRAWSGIASSWWLDVVENRVPEDLGLAAAREAAVRALQLDPGNAEAHLRLANCERWQGDPVAAEAHVKRALALDPDDPLVLSFAAGSAEGRGDYATAIPLQRRAVEADPLSVATRTNLAVMLYTTGHFAEARQEFAEVLELSPADDNAVGLLAITLVLDGQHQRALEVARKVQDAALREQVRALALHGLGRRAESDAALRELARLVGGYRSYLVAEVHAWRGESDTAFAQLDAALAHDDATCAATRCWPRAWLERLPLLRPLAADPRWDAWVRRAREPA